MSKGFWANIHTKRKRIAEGLGGKMSGPGTKGAPTEENLKKAAKKSKKFYSLMTYLLTYLLENIKGKICYK